MIRHARHLTSIAFLSTLLGACAATTEADHPATDRPSGSTESTGTGASSTGSSSGSGTGMSPGGRAAPDDDDDGVPNDRDLSPNTAKGVAVDADGAPAPSGGQPSPWTASTSTGPVPATGTIEDNGFMDIVLDPKGKWPMVFRTLAKNVAKLPNGFHVGGTLLLQTPAGNVPIFEADALFELGASSSDIQTVRGRARVPFTNFGVPDARIAAPYAELGFDKGSNLKHVNAPLNDDRRYLYFQFSDKLEVNAGPLTIATPGGQEHTVVVDPVDPFFFVRADLGGLGKLGSVLQNVGIGVSLQGLIPFTPTNTWGITDVRPLRGHMYLDLSASMKLPDLPISLDGAGETVVNLDPAGNGETVFRDPTNGIRFGGNRQLAMSLELIPDVASLSLELGQATFEADLLKATQNAWVSGVMYPGKSVLGEVLGVVPSNDVKFAGYISRVVSDSYFDMAGTSTLELSKLGAITGLGISDIELGSASFHVAKDGVAMMGRTQASFLSSLGIGAAATLEAKFPGDPAKRNDWYVKMNGGLSVSGVDLSSSASAELSARGVHVDGRWRSPLGQSVQMTGDITRNGFLVSGSAEATIPIAAFDCTCTLPKMCDQARYCNEAKECSVANSCSRPKSCSVAKSCTVKCDPAPWNWGDCFKSVVDATRCGTEIVVDATRCGTEVVEDAARCGTRVIKDATRCGTVAVQCGVNQVQCGTIQGAGAVCGAVCDGRVLRDLGKFVGKVTVSIGSDGLRGTVEGDYSVNGSTQHLVGGRLDLTSTPRACIAIPGGLGEFCREF